MIMTPFNDIIRKYSSKNDATSNIKFQQILSCFFLNDVGIHLRSGPFSSDVGIVNLHPSKGTHWVKYINENYFDSYGGSLPNKLSKFNINEMVVVYIPDTKAKVYILIVQHFVCICFT